MASINVSGDTWHPSANRGCKRCGKHHPRNPCRKSDCVQIELEIPVPAVQLEQVIGSVTVLSTEPRSQVFGDVHGPSTPRSSFPGLLPCAENASFLFTSEGFPISPFLSPCSMKSDRKNSFYHQYCWLRDGTVLLDKRPPTINSFGMCSKNLIFVSILMTEYVTANFDEIMVSPT